MFLTKIELDPTRRLARKYLGSPQVMHAVVLGAAGDSGGGETDDGSGRVLWRVDRGAMTTLYLLSPSEPDCSQIVTEAGAAGVPARTLDYSPFLERLDADQLWAFRLAANPSDSASRGPGMSPSSSRGNGSSHAPRDTVSNSCPRSPGGRALSGSRTLTNRRTLWSCAGRGPFSHDDGRAQRRMTASRSTGPSTRELCTSPIRRLCVMSS